MLFQRNVILREYLKGLEDLFNELSHSDNWIKVTPELLDSIADERPALPQETKQRIDERFLHEPLRQKILAMQEKVRHNIDEPAQNADFNDYKSNDNSNSNNNNTNSSNTNNNNNNNNNNRSNKSKKLFYNNAGELRKDLELLLESLRLADCKLGFRSVKRLIDTVDIFGFHLAKLDIRQHSARHTGALDEVCRSLRILPGAYEKLNEDERVAFLTNELRTLRPLIPHELHYSNETADTIQVFRTMAECQDRLGIEALDTYIVSMTQNMSDLLCIHFLLKRPDSSRRHTLTAL